MSRKRGAEAGSQAQVTRPDHDATPRVSVVIPVYNGEQFLPQQLDALAQQRFAGDWEVIVADNGSTDGSADIPLSYRGVLPEVRVVSAATRQGPSHARNVGASLARGALLLFCDADDVVGPGWVDAMVAASRDGDILAGSGAETTNPTDVDPEIAATWEPPNGFRFLPWTPSCNLAVSRAAFEAVGGFDEKRRIGEDVDFCWRVQLAGYRFTFVPDAFVAYRDRSGLVASLNRRFVFGRAAPGLYLDFARDGAPRPGWRWLASDLGSLVLSTPGALARGGGRGWAVRLAGVVGNAVGLLSVWRRRRSPAGSGR